MGRKKKVSDVLNDPTRPHGEHPIITEMLKGDAADQDPIIGLPLPSLAARYLLQSTIFPFSRFIQLRGMYSAGKSAMLMEIMRWYQMYGGMGVLIDTENKASTSMLAGIYGHNQQYLARTKVRTAESVEEWQKHYIGDCKKIHSYYDDTKNETVVPFIIGVDSISAVDIERRVEKASDEGHAAAGHPALARNLSDFMRTALVPTLRHYPITFVATNHLKEEIDSGIFGAPKKYAPGGAALDYYATLILDMERASNKAIEANGKKGQSVRITATKNNLGAPGNKIVVNLLWYNKIGEGVDADGNREFGNLQHHYWDWHTASARLLIDLQDAEKKLPPGTDPRLPELIKEVCDLEYKHGTKNSDTPLVWSKALDISKGDAVPEVEAAMRLEENPQIVGLLHGLLGINKYKVCDPALRYRSQILADLQAKQITDQPELMAAEVGMAEDIIPADFDPLNQFGGGDE